MLRRALKVALAGTLALGALACRPDRPSQLPSFERPRLELREAPALGMHVVPTTRTRVWEMTAAAQEWPSYEVKDHGSVFVIALDTTDTVRYISTSDPSFATPEGIRVGSTVEAVRRAGAAAPTPELGWASHTMLPSGWHAAFLEGAGIDSRPLSPFSQVKWLFKRR